MRCEQNKMSIEDILNLSNSNTAKLDIVRNGIGSPILNTLEGLP